MKHALDGSVGGLGLPGWTRGGGALPMLRPNPTRLRTPRRVGGINTSAPSLLECTAKIGSLLPPRAPPLSRRAPRPV